MWFHNIGLILAGFATKAKMNVYDIFLNGPVEWRIFSPKNVDFSLWAEVIVQPPKHAFEIGIFPCFFLAHCNIWKLGHNVLLYTLWMWISTYGFCAIYFFNLQQQTICIISARCCVSYTHTKHSIKHGCWLYYVLCMYCAYNAPQGIVLLSPQFPNNG